MLEDLLVAAGLFILLAIAMELGYRAGKGASAETHSLAGAQVGAVQGAVLGLLGLLLAFSFAAAGSRFLERQDLITVEANAIGTAYLRADLLDEPYRSDLRATLRDYTALRIDMSSRLAEGIKPSDVEAVDTFHTRMWQAAITGVKARPDTMLGVLPPVNDVIDLHSTRVAARHKHIPFVVLALLVACSALSVATIGYGCGMAGRRRATLTAPLAFLIGTALWITIDLDHPRAGLLQLTDAPLKALKFDPPGN